MERDPARPRLTRPPRRSGVHFWGASASRVRLAGVQCGAVRCERGRDRGERWAGRRSGLFDRRIGLVRQDRRGARVRLVVRAPGPCARRPRAPHRPHKCAKHLDRPRQPSINHSWILRFRGPCDPGNPCAGDRPDDASQSRGSGVPSVASPSRSTGRERYVLQFSLIPRVRLDFVRLAAGWWPVDRSYSFGSCAARDGPGGLYRHRVRLVFAHPTGRWLGWSVSPEIDPRYHDRALAIGPPATDPRLACLRAPGRAPARMLVSARALLAGTAACCAARR
jgi:hypothetical protein